MWKKIHPLAAVTIILLLCAPAFGWDPQDQADSHLLEAGGPGSFVGNSRVYIVETQETLMEIARDNRLGYTNLKNANPDIDPWWPPLGQPILLPYTTILPVDAKPGITINLAELVLYYLWEEEGRQHVRTYPLGVGSEGNETPTGNFAILEKKENPTWTVPESILLEKPYLPAKVPPGPANPLGKFWMCFAPSYGLHGTNKPLGIGRRVSHGCLRLYPDDIKDLFSRVPMGTPVKIIDCPVKAGQSNGSLFIEVHRNFSEDNDVLKRDFIRQARALNWSGILDWEAIERALSENRGIPLPVSTANL